VTREMNLNNVAAAIFCTGERTKKLTEYSLRQVGINDIIVIDNSDSFKEKYLQFASQGLELNKNYFIRVDGDHIVFSGVLELLEKAEKENYDWLTGVVHDYVMNRYRGGTPQILKRTVLEMLLENSDLMPESQKPESIFSENIRHRCKMGDVKIFTALHEYEQYPSKVCNSFLNRLHRNHYPRLYDDKYLQSLPDDYKRAIEAAFESYANNKKKISMSFVNFEFLDKNFEPLNEKELETIYKHYKDAYNKYIILS